GTVFVSVSDRDKRSIILPVLRLQQLGYEIAATEGTAEVLRRNGIAAREVLKFSDKPTADSASVVELIHRGEVDVVVNTPSPHPSPVPALPRRGGCGGVDTPGRAPAPRADGKETRAAAVAADIPLF